MSTLRVLMANPSNRKMDVICPHQGQHFRNIGRLTVSSGFVC